MWYEQCGGMRRRYAELPLDAWPADGVLRRPEYNVFVLESRAAGRRWTIDMNAKMTGGEEFTSEALDAGGSTPVPLEPSHYPANYALRHGPVSLFDYCTDFPPLQTLSCVFVDRCSCYNTVCIRFVCYIH